MDFFQKLGSRIIDRWHAAHFDEAAFPAIAANALRESPPSEHVDPMDVVRWVHEAPVLTRQAEIGSDFGQPAITVFSCERFYVDVLFWVDGTTSIHQHGFSGAFHVLAGSSLQSTYEFKPSRRYSEHFSTGRLDLVDAELLTKGAVRAIEAGSRLIHALFHLDRPSVSVVVRTPSDAFSGPQYTYSRAGIAFDPFAKTEALTRKLQTLDFLHRTQHAEFEALARASIRSADPLLAFNLLTHVTRRIEPYDKALAFLQSIRPAHGELLDILEAHIAEERRVEKIVARRRLAKHPPHRFFLALLLNLPDHRHILEMVEKAFPGRPPVETIRDWLTELARIDSINAWVTDVSTKADTDARILDVPLDAASIAIACRLLDGAADDEIAHETHASAGDGVAPSDAFTTCAALRRSPLLGTLFAR